MQGTVQRTLFGCIATAAVLIGAFGLLGTPPAEASKGFSPVTKIACAKCHTSKAQKDMSDKDLSDCGKKSQELLKKGGYPGSKDEKVQKEWAEKLLKGFKC